MKFSTLNVTAITILALGIVHQSNGSKHLADENNDTPNLRGGKNAERKLELWTPDCSQDKNKGKPPCICRYPTNWDSDTCKDWFAKPWVQENYNIAPESPNPRIIEGDPVSAGTYPWFAQARSGSSWGGCGGMLVAPEYVLTAAHCVGVFDGFIIGALCNGNNNCGQTSEEIQMSGQPISHPNYNGGTLDNDFALVKLQRRSTITPVPMDSGNVVSSYGSNKSLWPIGFGNQNPNDEQFPDKLYHVEVKYVPQSTCNSNYGGDITSNMMCAADPGQDSCQGDSGGPLMDRQNDKLVGVVSWGIGCAVAGKPGVYSKISSQWTWIKDTICDGHSSPKPGFCDGVPPSPTPPSPSPPSPSPPSPSPPSPSPPTPTDDEYYNDNYGYNNETGIDDYYFGDDNNETGVDDYYGYGNDDNNSPGGDDYYNYGNDDNNSPGGDDYYNYGNDDNNSPGGDDYYNYGNDDNNSPGGDDYYNYGNDDNNSPEGDDYYNYGNDDNNSPGGDDYYNYGNDDNNSPGGDDYYNYGNDDNNSPGGDDYYNYGDDGAEYGYDDDEEYYDDWYY